jgi:hypothetical protein
LHTTEAASDVLRWKLSRGGPIADADLALPALASAALRLCLYDASRGPQPIEVARVPAATDCGGASCWHGGRSATGAARARYRNATGLPDGVIDVRLRARRGALAASVKAQGPAFSMPARPVATPVTAQLVLTTAAGTSCWQVVLATAHRNDATTVKLTQ